MNTITKLCALLVLTAMIGGDLEAQEKAPPLQTKTKLAQLTASLEQRIPLLMKEADVPGLALALIRDGKPVWQHSFGVKNATTNEPVTDATVFEAASLSKPVFAYAIMKLVDAGKFDLDTPLNQYLPGNYEVGDDPRLGQITARRVLSHTTGFPNWRNGQLKIYLDPGTRFSYSGEGFVYLAKTIEHLTGEKFNDFMQRMVFAPLGMTSSSYVWRDTYDNLKTFRHNSRGLPVSQNKTPAGAANAAASLHTTAQDYARFVAAILNGTGLKPATRKLMLTPQTQVIAGGANSLNNPNPKPLADVAWGLGWGLQTTPEAASKDGLSFWHWGDNGDSKAYVVAFEKQKLGVVFFANSANGLSIAREIVAAAVGGAQPALAWLNYESYQSPGRTLFKTILTKGAEAALTEYRAARAGHPASETVNENQMNRLGYDLLGMKRMKDALEVFKQNVADYPKSANAYDSLGEAYATNGERELAIKNYERSLELNPGNAGGIEALKKLRENNGAGKP
ncbi:MAG: serine hydrolase [Acidobacteria bacterium]|nr:serine hydrolase [Acidobacteriota bacterium]MBI3423518.1 serine hydrolase [Acidobacteriota bacterium]